jgi:hypothetical protein
MSTVLSPFAGLPVAEVVPDAMEVRGVSKSSLLVGRRRIRFTPQNGTSQNPGGIIQFVLADSTSLLDVNSMLISFTAKTTGTGTVTFDDGPAWCRRIQVSLNGQLVDDTDNAHRNTNAQIALNADKSWYAGPGSFAGYWAMNPDLATNYASGSAFAPQFADVSGAATAASRYTYIMDACRWGDAPVLMAAAGAHHTVVLVGVHLLFACQKCTLQTSIIPWL